MYWTITTVAKELKVAKFKVRYWTDVYGVARFGHRRNRVDAKGRDMLMTIHKLRKNNFDPIAIRRMLYDR